MKICRKYFILLLLLLVINLVGCDRTKIIDKISIIHVFGFDLDENDELIGTALSPQYTMSKSNDQIQYLEERANTGILLIPKMAKHTSMPVEVAKIRVLVLGKSYAEVGIRDMVERFIFTPQLGTNIHITVSTQTAKETLKTFSEEKSLTLAERIDHNMEQQVIPTMNLHEFLNRFYGEGMDAYAPMLTIDKNNLVMVNGIGIFKDDQLKLHIKPKQTIFFSAIADPHTQATLPIELSKEERKEVITVKGFRSKSNWKWDQKSEQLNLKLHLEWTLTQYPDRFNVENAKDLAEMKKIIVEELEKGIVDLLTTFKENEVDPLGIGNIVRSQDRTWEKEAFYKKYPTLPINVKVDLQIIHSGLEG